MCGIYGMVAEGATLGHAEVLSTPRVFIVRVNDAAHRAQLAANGLHVAVDAHYAYSR
jgi:hypothetical protein